MITTTLQQLKDAGASPSRYKHLREELGKDFAMTTALPLSRILEINGREDALWALGYAVCGGDKILQLWAADCAAHIHYIWLKYYPEDARPADAIKATRQFVRGEIIAADLAAAGDAAGAAARAAARAAADAAWAADRAAEIQWQTARLIAYFNEEVKKDWPL